jgi:pimeloyl-ACP methyl ester carboxylesterase
VESTSVATHAARALAWATVVSASPDSTARRQQGPAVRSAWLDVDWRAQQRWVAVGGRPVNVIELGDGPPTVFVHGLSGCWQNWLEQLPELAHDHRVIALDLPGFGESPMPARAISIGEYARILDGLCDALDVDAAAFVGNSMGGFICAELAISFPQRVARLVLVSAAGLSIASGGPFPLGALARAPWLLAAYGAWLTSRAGAIARRRRLRAVALSTVARHPSRLPGPLMTELLRGLGKPGFLDAAAALTTFPIRDRLAEIACPTLIVWGDHDRLVPVRDAAEFARLIPNARAVVYEHTGHVAMLERPALFNADLRAFLAE